MTQESEIDIRARQIVSEVQWSRLEKLNQVSFERCHELFARDINELMAELGQKILDLTQVDNERADSFKAKIRLTTVWTYPASTIFRNFDGTTAGSLLITYYSQPAVIIKDGLSPDAMEKITKAAQEQCLPGEDVVKVADRAREIAEQEIPKIQISHELIHLLRGEEWGVRFGFLPKTLVEDTIGYYTRLVVFGKEDRLKKPESLVNFESRVGENLARKIILTNGLEELPSGFTLATQNTILRIRKDDNFRD